MPLYYRNEYLFSEIYLEEITQIPEQAEVLASLNTLKEYRDYADTSSLHAWKDSFVHQVLYALGFNIQAESENVTQLFPMGSVDKPISVCYILLPGENLDNTTMGRNWAEKIIRNLREHKMEWGLLTNGEQWRIYHQDEPTPYETYLEIDLAAILADKAREAYQIFHKFMRAENFTVREDGRCQFDVFKKESQDKIDYIEKELENALKQKEEGGQGVLSSLCMGYVEYLRQNGDPDLEDEELRRKIYHGAMLYMFRLLFLYYADARGLLSDDNHKLLAEVRQAAYEMSHSGNASEKSYRLWQDLETIFVDIDQTYNGGLFNPHESEFTLFIEESKILDLYLTPAVYHLAFYHEKSGEERLISYKDMSVRHLGTLYEGLLEHKLYIAKEDTEVRIIKGLLKFIPLSSGGKAIQGKYIPMGQVYFGSDASERKSTGSYYTPEFIVDYIIQKTFGSKLHEIKEKFMEQEQGSYNYYRKAVNNSERAAFAKIVSEDAHKYIVSNVLSLNVLDPAMGSGHFLVNATKVLSNFITELANELEVDSSLETAPLYWRRWVVENCIYGVDLNPLAVELAKLSLWILSMAKNQPLSFLKHHLKVGDSLVGADLAQIGFYPLSQEPKNGTKATQISLFESDQIFKNTVEKAVNNYRLIGSEETFDLDDVENKKKWLDEVDEDLQVFKDICTVHTSLYFGSEVDEIQYQEIVNKKSVPSEISANHYHEKYFHWELEFPDVFFAKGGFDIVIGNPPYDTIQENSFLAQATVGGTGNLFSYFISRAIDKNKHRGSLGYVVPLSLACGSRFEITRLKIYKNYERLYASHYSIRPAKLFPGVDQRITIFVAEDKNYSADCGVYSSRLWRFNYGDEQKVVIKPQLGYVGRIKQGLLPKTAGEIGAKIYQKILSSPDQLGSIISEDGDIYAYYHSVARYWIKAYNFIPYFKREDELVPGQSTKLKQLRFEDEIDRDIMIFLVNSSLFYYWWITVSDEFDVLISEIQEFRFPHKEFRKHHEEVKSLVDHIMKDYQRHSYRKTASAGGKKILYDEFYPRKSLAVIQEIDKLVADIYGFNKEETDFIGTYDHEFRTDNE